MPGQRNAKLALGDSPLSNRFFQRKVAVAANSEEALPVGDPGLREERRIRLAQVEPCLQILASLDDEGWPSAVPGERQLVGLPIDAVNDDGLGRLRECEKGSKQWRR